MPEQKNNTNVSACKTKKCTMYRKVFSSSFHNKHYKQHHRKALLNCIYFNGQTWIAFPQSQMHHRKALLHTGLSIEWLPFTTPSTDTKEVRTTLNSITNSTTRKPKVLLGSFQFEWSHSLAISLGFYPQAHT